MDGVDLNSAQQEIKELNKCIRKLEYNLELSLNQYDPNMKRFVINDKSSTDKYFAKQNHSVYLLCLNNSNYCISSLEIRVSDKQSLKLLFKSADLWKEHKLESILMAVFIIISSSFNKTFLKVEGNYDFVEKYEKKMDFVDLLNEKNVKHALDHLNVLTQCDFRKTLKLQLDNGRFIITDFLIKGSGRKIYRLEDTRKNIFTFVPTKYSKSINEEVDVKYIYVPYANTIIPVGSGRLTRKRYREMDDKPVEISIENDTEYLSKNNIITLELYDFITKEFEEKVKQLQHSLIPTLNKQLQTKCPNLSFAFDYYYNMEDITSYSGKDYPGTLLLCLNDSSEHTNCISSIELMDKKEKGFELNSFTIKKYRKKKYNKLLRAVCILIVRELGGHLISSVATNELSAYTMIKDFGAKIDETNIYNQLIKKYLVDVRGGKAYPDNLQTLLDYKKYAKEVKGHDFTIVTSIDVNQTTQDYFAKYLEEIKCL